MGLREWGLLASFPLGAEPSQGWCVFSLAEARLPDAGSGEPLEGLIELGEI